MKGIKTSYILSSSEMLFLLSAVSGIQPSLPAKFIIDRYLADCIDTSLAIEGLVYKKLISKNAGSIVIEPVVNLIVSEVLTARKLWITETGGTELAFILHTKNMLLYISRYMLIEGSWKVTPYQNSSELMNKLQDVTINALTVVDNEGNKYEVIPTKFDWLEVE